MARKDRTGSSVVERASGVEARNQVRSSARGAGGTSRQRKDGSTGRPIAWWPFWAAFLLVAIAVGVALAHGEMQMQNLRSSVDTLQNQMSALTTNLEARDGQFSDLVSQAELRLTSTVEEALFRRTEEALSSTDGVSGAASSGAVGSATDGERGVGGQPGGGVLAVSAVGDGGLGNSGVYVRVRPGDSLWEISRALWGRGSLYPTLAQENELDPTDPLPVDTLLRVPGRSEL